jgi:hypothetical protein
VTKHELDLDAVAAWLGGDGPIEDVQVVGGGTQNIMLRFRRGDSDRVPRRGPGHLRPRNNDALRRDIRVLRAPAATDVACPPSELESYTRHDGYAPHELPGMYAAAWLEERIPSTWTRGIVHEAR